jgi:hypothetical protein
MAEMPVAEVCEVELVAKMTMADGSTKELIVHRVVMDPEVDDDHGVSLDIENDWGFSNKILEPLPTEPLSRTMTVKVRGFLKQHEDHGDVLYQLVSTPAPEKDDAE